LERVAAETPDGNRHAVEGQWWNDGIHAGAVGEAGVDHRADFVHAAADFGDNTVDDLQQVGVVAEFNLSSFQLSAALHKDVLGAVDENIADGVVLEEKL